MNVLRLHEKLREAGVEIVGVSDTTKPAPKSIVYGPVRVSFAHDPSQAEVESVQQIIDNTSPDELPENEQAAQTAIQIAQELNGTDIRTLDAAGRNKLIALMAAKLGWVKGDFTLDIRR